MSHHTPSMDALLDVVINSNRLTTFVDLCFCRYGGTSGNEAVVYCDTGKT